MWLDVPPRPYRIAAPVGGTPFVCALFVADPAISEQERTRLAGELIAAGCRYAVCAGIECSLWHDWIDLAYADRVLGRGAPDEDFVMTSWHEGEAVADVLWFALVLTNFDDHVFEHLLVLVLGDDARLRSEIAAALAS